MADRHTRKSTKPYAAQSRTRFQLLTLQLHSTTVSQPFTETGGSYKAELHPSLTPGTDVPEEKLSCSLLIKRYSHFSNVDWIFKTTPKLLSHMKIILIRDQGQHM